FNHRNHRKSLIVDGRVAFTGGAGIGDQWMGNGEDPKHWHDMQVRVEGPAAIGLQAGFAQNWLQTTGELISGDAIVSGSTRSLGNSVKDICKAIAQDRKSAQ